MPFKLSHIVTLGVALILTVPLVPPASASRYEELEQKIIERNQNINRLEQEIAGYKSALGETQEEVKSLKGEILAIDLNRQKLGTSIQLTNSRIESAEANIERIELDMAAGESQVLRDQEQIAAILRAMDNAGTRSLVEIMFSHNDISEALQEVGELQEIGRRVRDKIEELRIAKEQMFVQKNKHEKEKAGLLGLHSELADQKFILDEEKKSQNQILLVTKNKETDYKKMLADATARKKQFESELEDFAAQMKQEIDPSSYPSPGSHILSMPLDGAKITQRFGRTRDSVRLYASGTHNGLDFGAPRGTKVYSAGDGVVVATDNTDLVRGCSSYGKWVLIKHPNGLATLYAHLDIVKVSSAQNVARHELIGYSGKTGYATGPHLHFGVYAAQAVQVMRYENSRFCKDAVIPIAPVNAYLDPEAYL